MLHDACSEPASFVTEMYRLGSSLLYLLPGTFFWRAMAVHATSETRLQNSLLSCSTDAMRIILCLYEHWVHMNTARRHGWQPTSAVVS